MTLEAFITSHLVDHCGIKLSYREFEQRFDRDEFVLLFDGFDEMAHKIEADQKRRNFYQIERLIKRYYEGSEVERVYKEFQQELHGDDDGMGSRYTEIDLEEEDTEAQPVVRFVDLIFKHAVHERAS